MSENLVRVREYKPRMFGLKRICVHGDKVLIMDWREDEWIEILPDNEYMAPPLGIIRSSNTSANEKVEE